MLPDDPVRDLADPLARAGDVQLRGRAKPHLAVGADHDVHPEVAGECADSTARSSAELLPT